MSEHAFGSRRVTTTSDSRRAMREQQAQKKRGQKHQCARWPAVAVTTRRVLVWLRGNNFVDARPAGDQVNRCAQGHDGCHWPHLDRLPAGPHVRQPQDLRRA